MKLLSVIVGGVATIAVAKPVAVDPANGTEQKLAFMIKSCQATGLAGACMEDFDWNLQKCQNIPPTGLYLGAKSIQVFDHFKCDVFSAFDCKGIRKFFGAGTFPNVGVTAIAYRCNAA